MIIARIMDNPNISLYCDQINRHQHRESGRVPLELREFETL